MGCNYEKYCDQNNYNLVPSVALTKDNYFYAKNVGVTKSFHLVFVRMKFR